MRWFVGVLILLAGCSWAQNRSETFGKSYAQIRAMGFERWSEFYEDRAGHTTLAMNDGAILFAQALNDGNRQLLGKLRRADRTRLERRLKSVESISDALMDARSRLGGSMWITLRARQQVYNEQFATRLIRSALQPPPSQRASKRDVADLSARARRNWDAIQSLLSKEPVDTWDPNVPKPATMKGLAAARKDMERLLAALAGDRPVEATTIARYLIELTDIGLFRRDE